MTTQTRTWLGYTFEHAAIIQPVRDDDGRIDHYYPAPQYKDYATKRLNRWGKGPFCRFRLPRLSTDSGVYAVTENGDPDPVLIGQCSHLAERWGTTGYASIQPANCYHDGQSTNCKVNHLILESAERCSAVELWFATVEPRNQIELKLIARLSPRWNLA